MAVFWTVCHRSWQQLDWVGCLCWMGGVGLCDDGGDSGGGGLSVSLSISSLRSIA